ncbi:hypothetical protein Y032_0003g1190 [Ancylostoma ceylanicum]|uniref:Peptidase A1 domain-containing protein n=1 Tax=Ancylostoma ceylanicum TaxID=53326 RepID=A0A016VY65_9BILA|nr:hypothetical protein Y032_0003g1190 [Ancylostoma ceylanicum]
MQFQFMEEHDLYYIDCNAKPSITLTVGKHRYTIESKNLIIRVDENTCILALRGYGAFWGANWILGAPFIRQFCNIYDVGNKQIGFANSLQI